MFVTVPDWSADYPGSLFTHIPTPGSKYPKENTVSPAGRWPNGDFDPVLLLDWPYLLSSRALRRPLGRSRTFRTVLSLVYM